MLLLPLTLLISAGKVFLFLSKHFLPGCFELKAYALLKANSSSLVAVFLSPLPQCVFLQGSEADVISSRLFPFVLISPCLENKIACNNCHELFLAWKISAYYTVQLIIEYFSARPMWEICPFKAYNICYIFCYFLNSQDLHLQIAFMNLNKIQIGKFCMTFLPSIMQVKSIHWMVYLDLINMNHELDQMAQVIPLQ